MKRPDDSVQIGFDTDRYIRFQHKAIASMMKKSKDRLYIEFGGKLIQDRHSARVLPGYREDAKLELLKTLCKNGESIFVVSSKDILRGRIRGDFGTRYDDETIRSLAELKKRGLAVRYVAISLLKPNEDVPGAILALERKLRAIGVTPYRFFEIQTYAPKPKLLEQLRNNPFISIRRKLILIISPGGGSGKFGICLNQLFHEMERGVSPRYLKFETFPVHDLPLEHPLNLAYMAASADFYDVVMRDLRHGRATSYQRDIENYELLHFIARKFPGRDTHLRRITSATNMGANMISKGIVNDELIQKEAAAEIARRLIRYSFEVKRGEEDPGVLKRVRSIIRLL